MLVMVKVRNADSEQLATVAGVGVNIGGEASAEAARTAAILSSKKLSRLHLLIAADSGKGYDSLAHQLTATVDEARSVQHRLSFFRKLHISDCKGRSRNVTQHAKQRQRLQQQQQCLG